MLIAVKIQAIHNLDASAASSCFLQLAKLCEKRGIFLCAAGVLPRVEWMLRSHHVAYKFDEEVDIKKSLLTENKGQYEQPVFGKLILFMTLFEVSYYGFLTMKYLINFFCSQPLFC